jgi:CHAT domain-containing protein
LTVADLIEGGIDLGKVNLLTLAACETGAGKVIAGDEVIGIGRAFLGSGAASVVQSLWKVSDTATAKLMRSFYQHLTDGQSHSDALRSSMIELLSEHRTHPYFFAPFTLISPG